jgi:hypothetical protein
VTVAPGVSRLFGFGLVLTFGVIWEFFKKNVFSQLDAECLRTIPAQQVPATLTFKSISFGSSQLILLDFILPAANAFSIGSQVSFPWPFACF